MNRAERRKQKIVSAEETVTYTFKKSEALIQMWHIIKESEAIKRLVNEEVNKALKEGDRIEAENIDTIILYNLYVTFGFNKKRLLKFAKGFRDLQDYYLGKFDSDKEDAMYAMKLCLKEKCGIDMKEFEDKIISGNLEELM